MTGTVELSPVQQRVVDELMAVGRPRPTFDADVAPRLLDALEDGLGPVAGDLDDGDCLWLSKHALGQIHACEAHHVALAAEPFEWNAKSARGTVVHKALELAVGARGRVHPIDLVDHAISRLEDDDRPRSPSEFLREAAPLELAELRAEATDIVTGFFECWPPLRPEWSPRTETSLRAELVAGRIMLQAKVDLVLGRARGNEARVLVVDIKTGRGHPGHVDDLRFYALVQTLRTGVPPFRIASYYLETGSFHHEDVTEELLELAVLRVVAGATKFAELRSGDREPVRQPGPTCGWCPARFDCEGSIRWREQRELEGSEVEMA